MLPKKCGHLNDKKLADAHDMAAKIAAAAKARRHLYLIARTDAAASEGIEGAVARARLYLDAGADAIFPEAMTSREMFEQFARRMPERAAAGEHDGVRHNAVLHRIGIRSDGLPDGDLAGVVAARCQQGAAKLFAAIRRDGGTHNMVDRMQTRAELYATIGLADYEALDASIVRTVVPEGMPRR